MSAKPVRLPYRRTGAWQMTDETIQPLVLDLLEWLSREPRSYAETIETWRTSCPRLPIWEDATDAGYVARRPPGGGPAMVELTRKGKSVLVTAGRA
jgi:hypothetical protein